jgi:CHAT domain-containing protein
VSRASFAIVAAFALTAACTTERPSQQSNSEQRAGAGAAIELFARGDTLYRAGEYSAARAMYDSASRVAGAGGDSATVARALTALGLAAWREGRFDDAQSIGEAALALKERLGLKADIVKSLNALGLLAQSRDRLDEAGRLFERVRAAAESLNDSGYVAKARANLGLVYMELADFEKARTEFVAAADAAKAIGDELTEANALNNLGGLETRVGDPDRAIASLSQARARYEELQNPVGVENALGQLGFAYAARGEHSRSIAYLDSAMSVAAKHELREPEADDLRIMAEVYESIGDHARALQLLGRARSLDDSLKMPGKLGQALLAEAYVHTALNNLSLAQQRARQAADHQRAAGARVDELDAVVYVAEIAQASGDSGAAQTTLAAARKLANDIGSGVARIKLALATARVADLAKRSGDVLTALDATRTDRRLLTAGEAAEVDALRARAYFRSKRYAEAAEAGRRAVASLEVIRGHLDLGAQRTSFASQQVDTYADLVITLLTLGRLDEAFRIADAARGRGLVERLNATGTSLRTNASAADLAAAEALLRRIDALLGRLRDTDGGTRKDDRAADASSEQLTRALSDARSDYERIVDRVTRVDTNTVILGARTVEAAAIRAALGPREALVEFLVADDRVLIFVLRRTSANWISVPVARTELAERVRVARALIADREASSDAPLRALHATLIAPIERAGLLNDVASLILVPHAALTYLPFAALRDSSSRYLVERYSIMSVSSASALPALRGRSDPTFTAPTTILAPLPAELPATGEEAKQVARRMNGARLVIGAGATERTLRAALAESPVVHVASHGALNRENPMFSSIRLASPAANTASSDDNGRFETHEVLSSPMRSRLVFLSGCETGLGDA